MPGVDTLKLYANLPWMEYCSFMKNINDYFCERKLGVLYRQASGIGQLVLQMDYFQA
jgi:hypothetical protein